MCFHLSTSTTASQEKERRDHAFSANHHDQGKKTENWPWCLQLTKTISWFINKSVQFVALCCEKCTMRFVLIGVHVFIHWTMSEILTSPRATLRPNDASKPVSGPGLQKPENLWDSTAGVQGR